MPNITKHFSYANFRPSSAPESWTPVNKYQDYLIVSIAGELERVLSKMPQHSKIKVLSGVVTEKSRSILKKKGELSPLSNDHLYGVPAVSTCEIMINRFGPTTPMTVGAVDIVPSGMGLSEFFDLLVDMTMRCRVKFGQVIMVTGGAVDHIHISNDPMELFSPQVARLIHKDKYLTSSDGGFTYSVYEPPVKTRGRKPVTLTV